MSDRAAHRICSYCGNEEASRRILVAGPRVWICDQCIQHTVDVVKARKQAGERRDQVVAVRAVAPKAAPHCSFCGKAPREVHTLVAATHAAICDECVDLAVQVCAESGIDIA